MQYTQLLKETDKELKRHFFGVFFFVKCAFIIANIVLLITFLLTNSTMFDEVAPSHWYFYKSSIPFTMSRKQYQKAVRTVRSKTQLAPGEYWLDNRKHVEYPLVHGNLKHYCLYNNDSSACSSML